MPEQLKIIIDADVQGAVQGFEKVAASAGKLTSIGAQIEKGLDFNGGKLIAQINELQSKLQSLKVKPVDVTVNTSGIDSTIKNIQAKFASLVDPKINVLANTAQAEASIKELIGELSALKGSEIFIRANDTQALKAINEIEAELNSLVGKQIRVNVDTTGAVERINVLEKELLSLETLKISPDVTTTQIELFEANIQRLKNEIADLRGKGIVVPINVNTDLAEKNVNELSRTIEQLRTRITTLKSFIEVETDITKVAAYNKEIQSLETHVRNLQNVGKKGFEIFVVPNQTINSVKSLSAAVADFGGGVKKFIPPAISGFTSLRPAIASASSALSGVKGSSSQATQSLINLGRVVQDAPFGFLGIANNLNPLLESFQRLKASTGTTGGALKALTNSLTGAGGIGFAISAVSSLLIVFGDELFKNKDKVEASAASLQKLAEELSTVKSNLGFLNDEIAFANQLGSINVKIRGQGDLQDLREQSVAQLQLIQDLATEARKAAKLTEDANAFVVKVQNDGSGKQAIEDAKNAAAESLKVLREAQKAEQDARDKERLIVRQIALQKIKDEQDAAEKVKQLREKQLADFEKFQNETIAKAQQFKKEFGETFILPQLEVSFFVNKDQVFKNALKVLNDIKTGNLKIKLPVFTDFEFLPTETQLTDAQLQELTKGFFEGVRIEKDIPVTVTPDLTLAKGNLDNILKKLDLEKQFSILGKFGDKEFDKIDFTNINAGIAEATNRLGEMMLVATTLNQAIGQGLVNAFNSVFDAINDGKPVFKALAQALKQLVIDTVKAVAQMLILKAVTNLIFPGGGGIAGGLIRGFGDVGPGSANFGGIGGRTFNNVIQIVGSSRVSGNDIVTSYTRATNSSGRFG